MVAPVYATPTQYYAFLEEDLPGDVDNDKALKKQLREASRVVDDMLFLTRYPVDAATLLPTDPDHLAAIVEATCATVEWFEETGDTTGASAGGGSIGSLSLPGSSGQLVSAQDALKTLYAPKAWAALKRAGLVPAGPTN